MSKFKKSMLIFGALILCVAVALVTFLALGAFDLISADPIALEFTVVDNEKVYDGKPLAADWYYLTKGELLKGHRASVEYYGSITNVGEGAGDMRVRIVDEDDRDVTSKYSVKVNKGKLTITPAFLRVRLKDIDTVYNGAEIACNEFEVLEGTPGAGHTLALRVGSKPCNSGDRLELEDDALHVYDAVGADVTKNYELEYEAGNITISPRPITLRPVGENKVYDGIAVETTRYEIVSGSLAPEQSAKVTVLVDGIADAAVTDAGEYGLTIDRSALTISDRDGKNVTENYDISVEDATLAIKKRPLALRANSATKTYDGRGITVGYTIEEGTLAAGHRVRANLKAVDIADPLGGACTEITDAGTYTVSFVETGEDRTDVLADGASVLDNYELTFVSGSVLVEKRPLTLKPKEFTKTYDGIAADVSECAPSDGTTYAPGHRATITVTAKKHTADGYVEANADNIRDAGSYTLGIDRENITIETAEGTPRDVTKNYAVSVAQGTVTIAPRTLFVTGASRSFTYDGNAHRYTENTADGTAPSVAPVSCSGLPTDHAVSLDYEGQGEGGADITVTNVKDTAVNKFTATVRRDGKICTDNFDIVYTFGTLTVTKGEVVLRLRTDLTAQYTAAQIDLADFDGDNFIEDAELGTTDWSVAAKNNLELVCAGGIVRNAGEYVLSVQWKAAADKTVQQNVTLTVRRYGKITVTPCELTLSYDTSKAGIVYGDTAVPPLENFVLSDEGNIDGFDDLGVYIASMGCGKLELTKVGDEYRYLFTPQNVSLRDGNNFVVTDNYTFGAAFSSVQIPVQKRKIALGFSPFTGTYASLTIVAESADALSSLLVVKSGSLAGSDAVSVIEGGQGELDYENNLLVLDINAVTVTDAEDRDVTELYEFINGYDYEGKSCIAGAYSAVSSGDTAD